MFSQLFSHRDFDTPRNLIYMSCLGWYDAKFIKKSWSFQNHCVFPLFSRKEKSAAWISPKLLIFSVDQPGLEPGTSRLWVCCSNQLSYKSDIWECKSTLNKWEIQTFLQKSSYLQKMFGEWNGELGVMGLQIWWLFGLFPFALLAYH